MTNLSHRTTERTSNQRICSFVSSKGSKWRRRLKYIENQNTVVLRDRRARTKSFCWACRSNLRSTSRSRNNPAAPLETSEISSNHQRSVLFRKIEIHVFQSECENCFHVVVEFSRRQQNTAEVSPVLLTGLTDSSVNETRIWWIK